MWFGFKANREKSLTMLAVFFFAQCLFIPFLDASAQTTKEELRLLDKPTGSPFGGSVSAGTAVKVVERQGFWVKVEAGGRSGWVKASALSYSSGTGGPTAIDTGRLGTGNIVATSAARGLSAKDILNGAPRMEEVAKMAQFAPDSLAVQLFATQGRLVALAQPIRLKPTESATRTDSKRDTSNENVKPTPKKGADDW